MASQVPERPMSTIALMVTRRCNMACAHCSVASSSRIREQPAENELEQIVHDAADAGVQAIIFTGGEPMIREKLVVRLMSIAKKRGLVSAMTTNGFWGKTLSDARRTLGSLCKSGLSLLTLSYDRYHAEFQGPAPGQNILRAAKELGIPLNLNVTRVADDSEISDLVKPFEASNYANVRLYDVQPVGRALDLPASSLRAEVEGACDGARVATVTDDGRVTACNGPAYFQRGDSPLVLGRLGNESLKSVLEKHRDDPILQTIRIFGPSKLRYELSRISGFEKFPWKSSYAGLCDLCLHINSDPAAAAALRAKLSEPKLVAERAARSLLVQRVASKGRSGRAHSIGPGSARLWMRAARGEQLNRKAEWDAEVQRVLGRPDSDWSHLTDYIAACGLSRVILPVANDASVSRWAPAMFRERLSASALREGRRELVQRMVLDSIDAELSAIGSQGILLKGAAIIARDNAHKSGDGKLPRRGAGDIDILVPPAHARELWERLSRRNGTPGSPGSRTGPHHLPAVTVNGLPIEIHTRIMPSFWGLPESEIVGHAEALPQYESLSSLDTEGMILHALMHSASHMFGYGLKAAWDVAWLLERHPHVDEERMRRWIEQCAMPAGFYLPAAIIKQVLGVPIPTSLVRTWPSGSRFEAIERILRQRFFIAMEHVSDLNPITKHGMFMLLHTTWRGRTLHAASLFGKGERESRASWTGGAGMASELKMHLREASAHLKGYRRTLAAARSDARDEQAALLFDA